MNIKLSVIGAAIIAIYSFLCSGEAAYAAELDCLIEPYEVVNLGSPVQGFVDMVTVDRGDRVKKGQALFTLDSRLEKAAVNIARARAEMEGAIKSNQLKLDFSDRRVARTGQLAKEKIISTHDMDESETEKLLAGVALQEALENKRLARLELGRANADLALRTILSPIDGVVVERFLSPGELAGQEPILKLAQIHPLRVEVFAPVSLIGKISVGMRAEVIPEQPVGGVLVAKVTVVDRVVDAASGTFGVRLELPNSDYRLPAGLQCKVRFPDKQAGGTVDGK